VYALIGIERDNRLRWTLKEGTYLIGRRDDCSFRLSDATVSRTHASIDISSSGCATATDLNSLNGTFLNGRRITRPSAMPVGSLLGLGNVKILFVDDTVSDVMSHTMLDLQRDIDLAAQIERKLIEKSPAVPGGYLLSAHLDQCGMVGGDMYDIARLANDDTAIMIGDAVGHGIGATVLMTYVLASYRTQCYQGDFEPGNVVSVISRLLYHYTDPSQFITAFVTVLESKSGQLRYVNAGHNSPIIVRANGSTERLNATGTPVGIMDNLRWDERTIHLSSGDLLFVFTDGLIETSQGGELFGEERLIRVLLDGRGETPEQTIKFVIEEVKKFAGDRAREDDTTIIALKRI
jgi:sigma-B regulation protein RsbU (phosphoserine phosphatase)